MIQTTLDDNATGASNLNRNTIRKNICMDDVKFGVERLNDAKIIAHGAIKLFNSCDFKLVKWSANQETLYVLADLDKKALVFGMRDLHPSEEYGVILPVAKALKCV